ncbi:hypothetical protein ACV4QK_20680 (plasmid) [Alteromonas macleodii]|jgi:hypothetical protein
MIRNLTYYYRLISYKFSLQGEDNDATYRGSAVFHDGKDISRFNIDDIAEGYPTITNIKLSERQLKLKERELRKLKMLKEKAKTEREEYKDKNRGSVWQIFKFKAKATSSS